MELDPFILRSLAAGFGIALVAGALGCFVVWRRMAYFGDSLAHSALLGVAFGLSTGLGVNVGTVVLCLSFACMFLWLQSKRMLAMDTLLGILAHAGLSIGLVAISVLQIRIDLPALLFGDILTVTAEELYWIYIGGGIVLALLASNWQSLVLITIHEDLARAENVSVFWLQIMFMFLMTIAVAVSIRIVGILLITSLLIIPAASARQFVASPTMMAVAASLLGTMAVYGGIAGSIRFDTPTGPSIVVTSVMLFAILFPLSLRRRVHPMPGDRRV